MSRLIIVESPAKCAKIADYAGSGYTCLATFGHLRELPDLEHIVVAAGYRPHYVDSDNPLKKRQIYKLREAIRVADEVIIATDDDREGEAIGWTICDMFGLSVTATKRIIFHEITKPAIQAAMATPRTIDMNMVMAQQARQVIDLIIGYKITPTLWKWLSSGSGKDNPLSAGRCQTPALRLVYDNDHAAAVKSSECSSEQAYKVVGYFTPMTLAFELSAPLPDGAAVEAFLTTSVGHQHRFLECTLPRAGIRAPPTPLTTSALQQAAHTDLHIGVKDTMKVAQALYEKGKITYMRTDSPKYAAIFVSNAGKYIAGRWGADHVRAAEDMARFTLGAAAAPPPATTKKSKATKTTPPPPQAAHEAIRPTDPLLTPQEFAKICDVQRECRLYRLIWERTMASCMAPARVESIVATVGGASDKVFERRCERVVFAGWMAAYGGEGEAPPEWDFLRTIKVGALLPFKKIEAVPIFERGVLHHTEANLVRLLEEMGIGRPSTFAMLVDKIQEREYVKTADVVAQKVGCIEYSLGAGDATYTAKRVQKEVGGEKNKLLLQPIGRIVSDFLHTYFANVLNYEYTAHMEAGLDMVAAGEKTMAALCAECDAELEACLAGMTAAGIKKIQHRFDADNVLIVGRAGPIVRRGKTTYLPLRDQYLRRFDMALFGAIQRGEVGLAELVDEGAAVPAAAKGGPTAATAQERDMGEYNGLKMLIKSGRFGLYVSVGGGTGKKTVSLKALGEGRTIDSFTREEVVGLIEGRGPVNPNLLRSISDNLSIRRGPKGTSYIYFKTPELKKPMFYKLKGFLDDPLTCPLEVIQGWIREKYRVY